MDPQNIFLNDYWADTFGIEQIIAVKEIGSDTTQYRNDGMAGTQTRVQNIIELGDRESD